MPRARNIYLIRSAANPATLLGAFTVKYEANRWLLSSEYNQETARLSRMRDGSDARKDETEIEWNIA